MKDLNTFDTDYTHDPVCPHCGHVQGDAWEIDSGLEGDTQIHCGECDIEFNLSRHVEITYSTSKIKK